MRSTSLLPNLQRVRCAIAAASLLLAASSPVAAPLAYVEHSSGLSTPTWESGLTELELADIDGDGNVDILSLGDHGNPNIGSQEHGLLVWFGDGAGNWTSFMNGNFGYGGIATGDVNGDGTLDICYAMHHNSSATDFGDQIIEAATGDGSGMNWTAWDDGLAGAGETYGMFATDVADIDCDGRLDLASLSFGCCNGLHVYRNRGDGTWGETFASAGGNTTTNEITFGDANGDGVPDLAAGSQNGTVWIGDGAGGFTLSDTGLPATGFLGRKGSFLADANRDGRDDLSLVNSSGGVDVWLRGVTGSWTKSSTGLPATGAYVTAQMDDMNGDGSTDVVAFGGGSLTVWTGNGGAAWTQATTIAVAGTADALRIGGDADHNGRPDIAVVVKSGARNTLRFFEESTAAAALSIRVTSPGGGESAPLGGTRFIRWASGVPGGAASTIRLELSTTGQSGPWSLIANNLPDNGRYQWKVPASPATAQAFIRATVTAGTSVSAVSPAPFSLVTIDSDGDGAPNWADCAIADPGARSVPVEISPLLLSKDPAAPVSGVIASWPSQGLVAGTMTRYDVISGPIADLGPDGVLNLAACAGNDLLAAPFSFALAVSPGQTAYVLARAVNVCGSGGWGQATDGMSRTATACP